MAQHKWHKEIKAWADGATIQEQWDYEDWKDWKNVEEPEWDKDVNFRIKPQPKESRIIREMKEAMEDLKKSLEKESKPTNDIKYWLCCGSLNPQKHYKTCCEAKTGYRERCRFGTVKEHQDFSNGIEPKEPQYLYAIDMVNGLGIYFGLSPSLQHDKRYIGKIKLEVDE